MILLVPVDVLVPRRPDAMFAAKAAAAAAARQAGVPVALVDHDAITQSGDARQAVARVPEGHSDAVYRGWMMGAAQYEAFAGALAARGVTLRTTAAQYRRAHELPGWYQAFAGLTPDSAWTSGDHHDPQGARRYTGAHLGTDRHSPGTAERGGQHRRAPRATSSFEKFADGLGMPPAARQALGLAPQAAGNPGIRHTRRSGAAGMSPAGARPAAPGLSGTTGAGLAVLCGLESVRGQLEDVVAVLEAERSRRNAGLPVRRQAWKNLVFTGGPGSGKSRAAAALGHTYKKLGVLTRGHIIEAAAADLAGTGPQETAKLLAEAIRPASGGILLINGAHDWQQLPDHGQQVLRRLYAELTEYRNERKDELAVILAGQAEPLRELLDGNPSLAPRFRAVIHFPGYTPRQLAAVFAALAGEAGLRLTSVAGRKAADVLAQAEGEHGSGNARLAVRLLNQATAAQARRVAIAPSRGRETGALHTITDADIPDYLPPYGTTQEDDWSGLYL